MYDNWHSLSFCWTLTQQRLGSISLKQDDEQAIELFDWAGAAVARANALEKHFLSLSDRHRVAEDTIQQLTRQLEELTRAKSDHENQLIANFAQLLNEKKLKVRNQQRLLTSAKVDTAKGMFYLYILIYWILTLLADFHNPDSVSEIQAATSTRGRSSIQKSRRPKRDAREMSKDNSESEIEFEEMQVDSVGRREREEDQETDEEERSTPQPLEEEGDNGTTTDEESVSWLAEQEKKDDGAQSPNMSNRPMLKEPAAPPPRRELPFAKRASEKKEVQNQTYQTEDDNIESTAGETDDDELWLIWRLRFPYIVRCQAEYYLNLSSALSWERKHPQPKWHPFETSNFLFQILYTSRPSSTRSKLDQKQLEAPWGTEIDIRKYGSETWMELNIIQSTNIKKSDV